MDNCLHGMAPFVKEYTAANGNWNLDKTVYIVYDDYKQIAEYVNGELHQQYARDVAGLDTVAFMGKNNSTYMYWTDGNKNVLKLFDSAGPQASYSYDPFGNVTAGDGSLATDNPFRFSSEYHNDITELVEYIYRKYDPALGRWINRDPIEEQGGWNLYVICKNNEIIHWDTLGTTSCKVTVYMGHNSEISKLINCQQNDFCKNISLGCGLDENNVVRKNSINGKFMPKTIGKVEFYSAMKNSPIPADYEERNSNGIADYQQIRSFIASQYQGHDTSIYENYATTVYYYVRAHIKLGITEALRLTKNKRCKRCCPNGIDFEVIIVDGMSIIYDKNVSKNFPTLEMLGNLKLNFPCR